MDTPYGGEPGERKTNMRTIRVDPAQLKDQSTSIQRVGQQVRKLGEAVSSTASRAPSYDGQFGPRVIALTLEVSTGLSRAAGRLAEHGDALHKRGDAFEQTDQQSIEAWGQMTRDFAVGMDTGTLGRDAALSIMMTGLGDNLRLGNLLSDGGKPWWQEFIDAIVAIIKWIIGSPPDQPIQTPTVIPSITMSPTPLPSPTTTPTPFPTATLVPPQLGTVLAGTNFRSSPDLNDSSILQYIAEALQVTILRYEFHDGWIWYYVRLPDGHEGWIRSDRLDVPFDISKLPVYPGPFVNGQVVADSTLPGFWGHGRIGDWLTYTCEGYLNQFLNIPGYSTLTNMCGLLVIMKIAGQTSLIDGFNIFKDISANYWDDVKKEFVAVKGEYLLTNNIGATVYTMISYFSACGYDATWGKALTLDVLTSELEAGHPIVVQVGIDQFHQGVVVTQDQNAQHWVQIEEVFRTPDNTVWVKVYNPGMNTEEYYTWETIKGSMENNDNIFIDASQR
jgi:uncharacterized protein YukE